MPDPRVSVVIPNYNRDALLVRAVESVLSQGVAAEVIVVDDASPVRPVRFLERFGGDPRVRFVQQPVNGGGANARNEGIRQATAPLLAFLDSDDYWLAGHLALKVAMYGEGGLGPDAVLVSRAMVVSSSASAASPLPAMRRGESIAAYVFRGRGLVQTSCVMLPSDLAKRVLFAPDVPRLQDWDFYLRLDAAGAEFHFMDEALTVHDVSADLQRISSKVDPAYLVGWLKQRDQGLGTFARVAFYANKVAPEYVMSGQRLKGLACLAMGAACGAIGPRKLLVELCRAALPAPLFDTLRRRAGAGAA